MSDKTNENKNSCSETPDPAGNGKNAKEKSNISTTLPIGLCLGVAIGTALDQLAIGISLGLCLGVALGSFTGKKKK